MGAFKEQIVTIGNVQTELTKSYDILLNRSENLAGQLNYQNKLIHKIDLNLAQQIQQAVEIQQKQ